MTFLKVGTATIKASQEGNEEYLAAESVTCSFTVNAVKPGAPTDFVVTPGDGQLTLAWTAPADTGGSPITDYEYSINDGTWVSTKSTETSYTVTELTNGTSYTIKVRAVNAVGKGEESISINATPAKVAYTITATTGTGGSISPNGSVTVNQGESQTFTITPGSNYSIEDVKVDGMSQGKIASYTFSDVNTNHSIAATFSYIGGSGGRSSDNDRDRSPANSSSIINITPASPDNTDSPTQAEIKVPVTVDANNNAIVNITSQNVTEAYDKALAEAKKNGNEQNGITVVFRVDTGNKTVSHVTVNLSKAVQDTIIAKRIVSTVVVVDNPNIQIDMDLGAVEEINSQANSDVNVTAAPTDSTKLTDEAQKAVGSRPVFYLKVNYGSGRQVQNFGDGRVTVTIPYTLGPNEKAENIYAVYIDDNGKVHWLNDSVYDVENKVLRFSTNHFSIYGVGYKEETPVFTDIANHWAKEDIEFVVRQGLFRGTSETTFSPNTAMTRGMFVTVLGRLAKADVSGYKESSFTDVKGEAYYMGYVEWARLNNIIKGIGNEIFAPDESITREQMAVILANYAKAMGLKLPEAHEEKTFTDSEQISAYAKEAVKQMQMAGVLNGKNGNLFDPQGTASRAEVSAVLHRFVELLISSDTQTH